MQKFIVELDGKRRKAEEHACENTKCNKQFLRRAGGVYKKRFCSPKCSHEAQKIRISLICHECGKKIEKTKSKMTGSKHGIYFCSRKCKEKSQSLNGNCPQIRPSHYGSNENNKLYVSLIGKTENPKCIGCGEDKRYLLSVHHIDGNRKNNPLDGSNWEMVCYNCHAKRHLKKINGKWAVNLKSLTPRNELVDL